MDKNNYTKKEVHDELHSLTNDFIKRLSEDDFNSIKLFGKETSNVEDLEFAIYTIKNKNFKLAENAEYIIRSYVFHDLSYDAYVDTLEMSDSDSEFDEQINLIFDASFENAKIALYKRLKSSLVTKYQDVVNKELFNLKEQGKLDNTNLYKTDSARLREGLHYLDVLNDGFIFSSVCLLNKRTDSISKGFERFVKAKIKLMMEEGGIKKTPEEMVIESIGNYYKGLTEKDRVRLNKILTKNNNEVALKMEQNVGKLYNHKGILKYNSPVDKNVNFYQTAFGLWAVKGLLGSRFEVFTIYTLTGKPIADAVKDSKVIANKYKLGIAPVWFAHKMYLRK